MSSKELPLNRLATTDATGKRLWLYPADVRGRFRRARSVVFWVLIALFFALPWIRIGGHPAVLLDIPGRRFGIFGLTLWAHDAPILFFLLVGAALGLAFVTAVFGRVWCGWACPQTVFIDAVFRRVERFFEGDAFVRRRLDLAPWSARKFAKKTGKWAVFTVISLLISHTFLAYFTGTELLLRMMTQWPSANPAAFLVMFVTAALVLFDFGWFREQFCTIVCPYGRFQSVLMDSRSLAVIYDPLRGEPRKGTQGTGKQGDCVNCYRCVQVCPTGIDIRRGMQMECIACTACIDACDEVMERVRKPRGLIRYDSEIGVSHAGKSFRVGGRGWAYLGILALVGAGLVTAIVGRAPLEYTVTRASAAPYMIANETGVAARTIINHFKIDLGNQTFDPAHVEVALPMEYKERGVELVMPLSPLALPAGQGRRADFFLKFPESMLSLGRAKAEISVTGLFDGRVGRVETRKEVQLVGPLR